MEKVSRFLREKQEYFKIIKDIRKTKKNINKYAKLGFMKEFNLDEIEYDFIEGMIIALEKGYLNFYHIKKVLNKKEINNNEYLILYELALNGNAYGGTRLEKAKELLEIMEINYKLVLDKEGDTKIIIGKYK